jgi:hypothetical protein
MRKEEPRKHKEKNSKRDERLNVIAFPAQVGEEGIRE